MPQPTKMVFTYQELAKILVREAGIKEGHWGVFLKFGLGAANMGSTNADLRPAAIVAVTEVGIQRFEQPSNLTVDAAEVDR